MEFAGAHVGIGHISLNLPFIDFPSPAILWRPQGYRETFQHIRKAVGRIL